MTELENDLNRIKQEKLNKIKPENIKKGVSIFGVEGTLDSTASKYNAKSFNSLEELEQDSFDGEYPEGTLGIVAKRDWMNVSTDTIVNTVKFPKVVVLSKVVEQDAEGFFPDGDYVCIGEERWNFYISLTPTTYIASRDGNVMVRYTSNDGLTYIRDTRLEDDLYKFDLVDGWKTRWSDSVLDNFIQEKKTNIIGIKQWLASSRIAFYDKISIVNNALTTHVAHSYANLKELVSYMKQNRIILEDEATPRRYIGIIEKAPNVYRVFPPQMEYTINEETGAMYLVNGQQTLTYYDIDMNTKTHTSASSTSDNLIGRWYVHEDVTTQLSNIIGYRGNDVSFMNESPFWHKATGDVQGWALTNLVVLNWVSPNSQLTATSEGVENTKAFIGKSGNSEIGTKTFESGSEYTAALNTAKEIKGGNV